MEKVTDRILWSILVLAIGVGLFVFGKPAFSNLLNNSLSPMSHSVNQWMGASFVNDQLLDGHLRYIANNNYVFNPYYDGHSGDSGTSISPFRITSDNGAYHVVGGSSIKPFSSNNDYSGLYIQYNDVSKVTGDGEHLHASVKLKGHGYVHMFGFEYTTKGAPAYDKYVDTKGKWQTITFDGVGRVKSAHNGLILYFSYYPNTDMYAKDFDASIY